MSQKTTYDQTLAIAGVLQAALLIQQAARQGQVDPVKLDNTIDTLFRLDVEKTEDVYGGLAGVEDGLRMIPVLFQKLNVEAQQELLRYSLQMINLARKLQNSAGPLATLAKKLDQAKFNGDYIDSDAHDINYDAIAKIYQATLSTISPKVIVHGEQGFLQQSDVAAMVRCSLLGGVRSAVLWSQCGGSRWQLIFKSYRHRVIAQANSILSSNSFS